MMMRYLFVILLASSVASSAQKSTIAFDHVEPPFWWTGMKMDSLQILFHNSKVDLSAHKVSINHPGIELTEVKKVANPHYLFVTIKVTGDAVAGNVPVEFVAGKKRFTYQYSLRERSQNVKAQGFDASDAIYLIMPDRFANGDLKNDSIPGMFEGAHRNDPGARHGGDLKGIADRLDYIQDLGITTLWLNPILENNQRKASYHGYAITDLYNVDRRFGTNSDFVAFVQNCHSRGMKVIQDMVMNHIGNEHWIMYDLPEKDWINQFSQFTRSNYRSTVISDPYRAQADLKIMNDGWFDTTMPDVNQRNPLFATYLVQNTIWWIEYAGIDGIRMDTYPYPDKTFMARWCKEVLSEYPKFNILGEVWINDPGTTAYWQNGAANKDGYQSNLPSVTDFPLFFTLPIALTEEAGWDAGLTRLYNLLARDFVYPDAYRNVIFLDNHDLSRFFLLCNRDVKRFKMGLAFLLTTRGIPQLYYGTELLMDGDGGHHPNVRLDFPGGWPDDKVNAFSAEGRTAEQNEAFDYIKRLLNWRKENAALHNGKLTHYIPENNVYVYFRQYEGTTVMVLLNGNSSDASIETKRFAEDMKGFVSARNAVDGSIYNDLSSIKVPGLSATILELNNGTSKP